MRVPFGEETCEGATNQPASLRAFGLITPRWLEDACFLLFQSSGLSLENWIGFWVFANVEHVAPVRPGFFHRRGIKDNVVNGSKV